LKVDGILATGTYKENQRDTFSLIHIREGRSYELAAREKKPGWFRYRRYFFNPSSFEKGLDVLTKGLSEKNDVLILDEIGPMELGGRGWYKALQVLDRNYRIPQVWVVRENILGEVRDRWNIPEENVFHIQKNRPADLVQRIRIFSNTGAS
jgi:iron complex transport system ATP-binding protein